MKYIKTQYSMSKLLFLFAVLSVTAAFISCSEEGAGGPPSITRVRPMNAQIADSSFVTALPGQLIVVEGINLSDVQEVYFNDYPATFNPAYNTATHLVVQIPMNTPTPDRDPAVSGILRVVTKHGSVDYQFAVNPPAPSLSYIYNENTQPGEIMEIHGQFLLSVNEVVFPGGVVGTDIQSNDAGTLLRVKVPEEVTETGNLTLRSPYGATTTNFLVNNTKGPGVFANFNDSSEPEYGWERWNESWDRMRLDDATLYPHNNGYYLRVTMTNITAWDFGWWNPVRNIAVNNYGKTVVQAANLGDPIDSYYLKFEINTRIPIREGAVFLIGFKSETINYEMHPYALVQNGVFDTENKWMTLTVPLHEFKEETIGALLESYGAIGRFHIGFISGAQPIPEFDAAFDNFRIERVVTVQ